MSTKIYDGFKINGVHTLAHLGNWVENFRESFAEIHKEKLSFMVQMMAGNLHTKAHFVKSLAELPPELSQGRRPFRFTHYAKDRINTVPAVKEINSATVQLLFTKDGQVLGIPFINYPEAKQCLKDQNGYEYYGYWDNSDPLEDISDEDWELRGNQWDEVIGCEPVYKYGLSLELSHPVEFIDVAHALDDIEAYWSNHRVHHIADELKRSMTGKCSDDEFEAELNKVLREIPPLTEGLLNNGHFLEAHGLNEEAGEKV